MYSGASLRRYQKKKEVDRFSVHGLEIDSFGRATERQGQFVNIPEFAVWDGDSIPYPGASQAFSFQQHPHEPLAVNLRLLLHDSVDQLFENLLLCPAS